MLAVFFLQYVELVRSKFRGAVMRVFRDRRADSDRSLRLGWTIFVWLMTRQLVSDVDLRKNRCQNRQRQRDGKRVHGREHGTVSAA